MKVILQERLTNLIRRMEEQGVDLAVFGCGPGFQYLTGIDNGWRFRADSVRPGELLLVPMDDTPILIGANSGDVDGMSGIRRLHVDEGVDIGEVIGKAAAGLKRPPKRIAVADQPKVESWLAVSAAFPDSEYSSGDGLLQPLRLKKDEAEAGILKKAAFIVDEAVKGALPLIRSGLSMRELQLAIEFEGRRLGASGTSFDIVSGFIKSGGEPTGSIFGYGIDQGLEYGTTIFFDIGFVVDGYCSDWGRSLFFGNPGTDIANGYRSLQHAMVDTVASIRTGETRVCDMYPMLESRLDEAGYGDKIRARLPSKSVGHQIGIEVHESPWFEPHNEDVLQPGMVFCLEPKLWDDGNYYMRVEDMVLITPEGGEFLTNFDRELFCVE